MFKHIHIYIYIPIVRAVVVIQSDIRYVRLHKFYSREEFSRNWNLCIKVCFHLWDTPSNSRNQNHWKCFNFFWKFLDWKHSIHIYLLHNFESRYWLCRQWNKINRITWSLWICTSKTIQPSVTFTDTPLFNCCLRSS